MALFNTEAEYIAAVECCKEALYLKSLIEDITGKKIVINLNLDNQSAIRLIETDVMNRKSKHRYVLSFRKKEKERKLNHKILFKRVADSRYPNETAERK